MVKQGNKMVVSGWQGDECQSHWQPDYRWSLWKPLLGDYNRERSGETSLGPEKGAQGCVPVRKYCLPMTEALFTMNSLGNILGTWELKASSGKLAAYQQFLTCVFWLH